MTATVFSTLSSKLAGKHPELGVLVREDGMVLRPKHGGNKVEWTKGAFNKTGKSGKGYCRVRIGSRKKAYIHVLVAETFIDNPCHKTQVDHINRIRTDNRRQNLRWVTPAENNRNTTTYLNAEDLGVRWCEDYKEAGRRYMRKKRQDPVYRETERQYEEKRRQDPEFRKKQAERCKQWRAKKKAEQSAQPS